MRLADDLSCLLQGLLQLLGATLSKGIDWPTADINVAISSLCGTASMGCMDSRAPCGVGWSFVGFTSWLNFCPILFSPSLFQRSIPSKHPACWTLFQGLPVENILWLLVLKVIQESQQQIGIRSWVTCCLAGNEESVVMAAKCSYVLAQGSIPVVKTLICGELGCYIYEGDTGSWCNILDIKK